MDKPSTYRQVAVQKLGLDILHNHVTQKVKQFCRGKRLNYCRLLRVLVDPSGTDILVRVFVSDEADFHRRGYVNSHNTRIWSKAKLLFSSNLPYISKTFEHVLLFLFVQKTGDENACRDLISQFSALRDNSIVTVGFNKTLRLVKHPMAQRLF
jgi:hypothetical protein